MSRKGVLRIKEKQPCNAFANWRLIRSEPLWTP